MKRLLLNRLLFVSIYFLLGNIFLCFSKNVEFKYDSLNKIFKSKKYDSDESVFNYNSRKQQLNKNSSRRALAHKKKSLSPATVLDIKYENSCNILREEPSLNAYLSPTVVKARAIEKFKYNSKSYDSYSIWFQIKKIYKYENKPYSEYSKEDFEMYNYFNISSDDETSDEINLNSFLFIENFNSNKKSLSKSSADYCNKIDIKLGQDYFLFLNSQDRKIDLENRRYFKHKISLSSLKSNLKKKSPRHLNDHFEMNPVKYQDKFSSLFNIYNLKTIKAIDDAEYEKNFLKKDTNSRQPIYKISKLVFSVEIPIFEMASKPILDNANLDIESEITNVLCAFCGIEILFLFLFLKIDSFLFLKEKPPEIKMNKKIVYAGVNHKINLECHFEGNPRPIVMWRKNKKDFILENNEKYDLHLDEK